MCVNNEQVSKMAMATATAASRFPRSPRSPYRRHLHLREPVKPRLSRRIISSARVNLNCYWSKFAEAASVSSVAMLSSAAPDGSLDNEINENLANEIQNLCSN